MSLESCVIFIDCTKIRINRPSSHSSLQRSAISVRKEYNAYYLRLYQPLTAWCSLHGPAKGRCHHLTLFRMPIFEGKLAACMNLEGRKFCINGDLAPVLRPYLQRELHEDGRQLRVKLLILLRDHFMCL